MLRVMVAAATADATTGMDLRLCRVARRVTVSDLAAELGVSRQRVSAIESLGRPTWEATQRYWAALERATVRR
jgi:transcriptional regulator with XRE-family HTH domain